MKLIKLTLKNIFSFYGKTEINFDDKTFIIAKNGSGKTSILNSFKLCLGKEIIKDIKTILNNQSKDKQAYIEIEFDEFIVKRLWNFEKEIQEIEVKFSDYSLYGIEADDFLNEKFPDFLVDLMFYDGEINSNIIISNSKNLFEYVFDLDILNNLSKDTSKAAKDLILENKELEDKSSIDKLSKNEETLIELDTKKISLNEELKILNRKKQKLQKEIYKFSSNLDNLNKQKEEISQQLNEKLEIFYQINLYQLPLILNPRLLPDETQIIEVKNKTLFSQRLTKIANKLGLNEEEFINLMNKEINNLDIKIEYSKEDFLNLLKEIKSLKNQIQDIQDQIIFTTQKLEDEKFILLSKNLDQINVEIENIEKELQNILDKEIILIDENKQLQKYLTKLFNAQKENYAAIQSYNQLQVISKVAKKIYNKKLSNQIKIFNKYLQKEIVVFTNIYSHISKIEIDNNLNIMILDNTDKYLDINLLSAGQKQLLNFLIIKAILNFKNIGEVLVVDTPLGRLSKENQTIIYENCYKHFSQLVLLLTDTEYEKISQEKAKIYHIIRDKNGAIIK